MRLGSSRTLQTNYEFLVVSVSHAIASVRFHEVPQENKVHQVVKVSEEIVANQVSPVRLVLMANKVKQVLPVQKVNVVHVVCLVFLDHVVNPAHLVSTVLMAISV